MFSVTTNTRYNAEGNPLVSMQKLLVPHLSDAIESKILTIDERNLTSTQWVEYHVGTKRKSYNTLPTSNITAETVTVDGFALSQTDHAGVTTTSTRSYTANGMIHTRTDGRGNTTTTVTDKAGRTLTVTDAAGNVTTTVYDLAHDLPATVTDAQGNTSCYRYDVRGRKVAEWGTGMQPTSFGYDDADRMTSLTSFRASTETVSTDPSDRTDGDVAMWAYHDASGMEISKTYADTSSVVKTHDAENRPVSFTSTEPNTVIEIAYDHMGRRATKKVTVDGEVTLHQRYLYRGYLQIACCDLTRDNHPALWLITWDPTQPIATRPLAIQKDATWYTYGWDLTKNICELYGTNGYIRTAYSYTPYGEVTESSNSVYQPIQWSSEYNDTELGLVYYNYRHYNPTDGRWLGRDKELPTEYNLYVYCRNDALTRTDKYGLYSYANRASTTRTETYDKNGYYETANGKTDTRFPGGGNVYYKKNGMHCIKTRDVAYVGKITLYKSWDLSKDYRNVYYFDREYKTVLEHEYHHVDITINNWNMFVNTSKMFEGCYCSKECASLAGGLIDIYKSSYQNNTHLENAYFDMSEYGEKLPDEHDIKKDLLKTISDSIEASDKIEESINNSLIKFNNCI